MNNYYRALSLSAASRLGAGAGAGAGTGMDPSLIHGQGQGDPGSASTELILSAAKSKMSDYLDKLWEVESRFNTAYEELYHRMETLVSSDHVTELFYAIPTCQYAFEFKAGRAKLTYTDAGIRIPMHYWSDKRRDKPVDNPILKEISEEFVKRNEQAYVARLHEQKAPVFEERSWTVVKNKMVEYSVVAGTSAYPDIQHVTTFTWSKEDSALFYVPELGDNNKFVFAELITTYFRDEKFPFVFNPLFKPRNPAALGLEGPCATTDGDLIYIPKGGIDKRKELYTFVNTSGKMPRNFSVLLDADKGILYHTDAEGSLTRSFFEGLSPIAPGDIVSMFERSFSTVFSGTVHGSFANVWPGVFASGLAEAMKMLPTWAKEARAAAVVKGMDEAEADSRYKDLRIADAPSKAVVALLASLKTQYVERMSNVLPTTYLRAMGLLMAYLDNANSYTKLKREVVEERKAFDRATAKTLKPIPMIGKGLRLFPHQAEALAKLQVGGTESILDVGTGGGKTILKLLYALSLMGEGKVKKPLIVVPNGLVGQWLGAIDQFTEGKVNGIAICTDTVNDWGEEDIESTVKSAPPNTIFLATYAFLIKGSYESYMGIEYPSIEWIKHIVNPDFVSLDESQFIRGSGSKRGAAINQFRSAKYKMIGTGTLIVNQATDTVQQVGFLNPRVFGSREQFIADFAESYSGSTVYEWKPDSAQLIRDRLRNQTFYLNYREKHWAAALPYREYKWHTVKMSTRQKAVYSKLLEDTLKEIMDDPVLKKMWLDFSSSSDEDDSSTYAVLLAKLQKLEQFITAPDSLNFVEYMKDHGAKEEDYISPKVAFIDSLIEKTLASGQKCIVTAHFKASAAHLLKYSKWSNCGVYIDSEHKAALEDFKNPDSPVKVAFVVMQNIKEGHNLQIAGRLIQADIDWTYGETKQLSARIWRPVGPRIETERKVFLDFVLCDESADIAKSARMISKKLHSVEIMEDSPVPAPPVVALDGDILKASAAFVKDYWDQDYKFESWIDNQIEELKKDPDFVPVAPSAAPDLPGSKKIRTPWVIGMPLPTDAGSQSLVSVIDEDPELSRDNIGQNIDTIRGWLVLTEFGEGKIVGASKKSVRVKLDDGSTVSVLAAKVIKINKVKTTDKPAKGKRLNRGETPTTARDPKGKEPKKVSESDADALYDKGRGAEADTGTGEGEEDNALSLDFCLYNGYYTIIGQNTDPDNAVLKSLGFIWQGPYGYYQVKNKAAGFDLLAKLDKRYSIPKELMEDCRRLVSELKRSKIDTEAVDIPVKDFVRSKHIRSKDPKALRLYPMIFNSGELYLVYDRAAHPTINLSRYLFDTDDGYWYLINDRVSALRINLRRLIKTSGYSINNYDEIKTYAKSRFGVNL